MSLIGRVAQQRLERPEAEHVVDHLGEERLALAQVERRGFLGEQLSQQRADLGLGAGAIGVGQRLEVQAVEQLAVHVGAQLEILLARRLLNGRGPRVGAAWRAAQIEGRCSGHVGLPDRGQPLHAEQAPAGGGWFGGVGCRVDDARA